MKFDQLIEYNTRNVFLEKSYTKCGGETIPRPCVTNWELLKYIETKLHTTCYYFM